MSEQDWKYTPGPWWVEVGDENSEWAQRFPVIMSNSGEIAGTEGFYSELAVDIANARLAAAAPELLTVLLAITEKGVGGVVGVALHRRAMDVINKAYRG